MKKEFTIRDVAREAGVSLSTVSRVLNKNEAVAPDLRKKVQAAIDRLGYTPNIAAQTMRNRLSRTVACIIREINIPFLASFVRSTHDVLQEAGFSLVISNSEGRRDRERELLTHLARRQTDGILIGPYTPPDEEFDAFLRQLGMPIVLVDRDRPAWLDAVMIDHRRATRNATDHLLDLGHRRIALLTGQADIYPAHARVSGYRDAFESRGLPVDTSLIKTSSFLANAAFNHTSAMLASSDRPTAIISGGMDMLSGILRAARVRGISIPRDLSVIGTTDSELAELHSPAITVDQWAASDVGTTAARLLLDRIMGSTEPPRHVLLPSELIIRQSTAGPATV